MVHEIVARGERRNMSHAKSYAHGKDHTGRTLLAAEDIPAGTTIVVETPWLLAGNNWELVFAFFSKKDCPFSYDKLVKSFVSSRAGINQWDANDQAMCTGIATRFKQSADLVQRVYAIMVTNSISVSVAQNPHTRKFGMFKTLTLLNHSCIPNVRLQTKSDKTGETQLIALRAITKGEQLVMEYTHAHTVLGPKAFQDYMKFEFGFMCRCAKCAQSAPKS